MDEENLYLNIGSFSVFGSGFNILSFPTPLDFYEEEEPINFIDKSPSDVRVILSDENILIKEAIKIDYISKKYE